MGLPFNPQNVKLFAEGSPSTELFAWLFLERAPITVKPSHWASEISP